jgi:hypothetical protein
MKRTALMFFLSLLLFSCEKEKMVIVENTDVPLLKSVIAAGIPSGEYSYNEANLINEERSKYFYTKHNYNDRNLLVSSEYYIDPGMFSSSWSVVEASMNRKEWVSPGNTEKSLTVTCEYNSNDQLTRTIYTRPSVSNSEYCEFSYENDRISRQKIYWNNALSSYIDFLYDENGNLAKESRYHVPENGVPELWTTTEYEYDNYNNPFLAFKRLMLPGKNTNQNNITKQTYTLYFDVDPALTERVSTIINTYEYNDSGYPVKVNGESEYKYK